MGKIIKATRKHGRGLELWNLDEGITVHDQFAGMTACRRAIGTRAKGWLAQEAWYYDVTCRSCLAALRKRTDE